MYNINNFLGNLNFMLLYNLYLKMMVIRRLLFSKHFKDFISWRKSFNNHFHSNRLINLFRLIYDIGNECL